MVYSSKIWCRVGRKKSQKKGVPELIQNKESCFHIWTWKSYNHPTSCHFIATTHRDGMRDLQNHSSGGMVLGKKTEHKTTKFLVKQCERERAHTHLCTDWMDSYCAVQHFFCHATFYGCCKSLGHFSSAWTNYMKTNNPLLRKTDKRDLIQAAKHNYFCSDSLRIVSYKNLH